MNPSILTKNQVKHFGPRTDSQLIKQYGAGALLNVAVRYDDNCGNGHNSFAITGEVVTNQSRRNRDIQAGGCLHEDIARLFPELAPMIKWHLTGSDGPMHYLQNTIYLASDRDHWGKAKGEPTSWEHRIYFGSVPIGHNISKRLAEFVVERMRPTAQGANTFTPGNGQFMVQAITHQKAPDTYSPHYTLVGFTDQWHEAPFRHERAAQEFAQALNTCSVRIEIIPTAFSEGKARELDKARLAAVWPDATDEELTAPGLKERLEARLPALLAEFRAAVESLGFTF